jgi:hypothetical protein
MIAYQRILLAASFATVAAAASLAAPVSPAPVSPAPTAPAPGAPPYTGEAALRFPQAVRVGDLIGRQVLEPTEDQHVLGRVDAIVRHPDGAISMLMRFGGVLGLFTRLIDVPISAVVLLGEYVSVEDFTPEQLAAFPAATEAGLTPLPPDTVIRVGLTGPFH